MIHGSSAPAAARAAPHRPGVYFFYSEDRQLLYIGKSLDLKRRLGQHFPTNQSVRPRPTRQQVAAASATAVSWVICGSELEALVLEDRFIKEHLPIANKRQKKFLAQQYIGINRKKSPHIRTFSVLEATHVAEWEIFGPYSDRYLAEKVLDIAARYVRCSARMECSDAALARLRGFLSGADDGVLSVIENQMQHDAVELRFEQAQRKKEHLVFCRRFLEQQKFVQRFSSSVLMIDHRNGSEWVFHKGALFEDERSRPYPPDSSPWWLLDRAQVVASWIRSHQDEVSFRFLSTALRPHGEAGREMTGPRS